MGYNTPFMHHINMYMYKSQICLSLVVTRNPRNGEATEITENSLILCLKQDDVR